MPEVDPMRVLREHAWANINNNRIAYDDDGYPATVRSGSVMDDRLNGGKITLIPFQWGGKIVDFDTAVKLAVESGIDWPTFETEDEATKASKKLSESIKIPMF